MVRQVSPAADNVLALSVELEVKIELARARGGVAGEADPGAGRAAGIAEDHGLHRDRRAGRIVDPVQAAVIDRLLRVPGTQHGFGRGEKLHARIGGEIFSRQVGVARQHRMGQRAQIAMVELPLALRVGRRNRRRDQGVERRGLKTRADLRVTLHQPPVAVPGQTWIGGAAYERFDRVGVQAHVEHRLHHARHGNGRAGAHRHQQRSARAAECASPWHLEHLTPWASAGGNFVAASARPHHAVGNTKAGGTAAPARAIRIRFQALLPTSSAPPGASADPRRIG